MQEIWSKLTVLERGLPPWTRWLLTGFVAIAGMNYALEFGEKLGRALYHLIH
jgi:hypothetical protein